MEEKKRRKSDRERRKRQRILDMIDRKSRKRRQKRTNVHTIRKEATEPECALRNKSREQEFPGLGKSAPKWQTQVLALGEDSD